MDLTKSMYEGGDTDNCVASDLITSIYHSWNWLLPPPPPPYNIDKVSNWDKSEARLRKAELSEREKWGLPEHYLTLSKAFKLRGHWTLDSHRFSDYFVIGMKLSHEW
jgi:hypothetical protein